MDVAQYIKHIQMEIKDKEYDDYVYIFDEYKKYLENLISENSKDVKAICQLAAVRFELRCDIKTSIDIMENLLHCFGEEMSSKEKARVYTNLSYFYEDLDEQEKSLLYLKKAVELNSDYPNAYDALGRLYMDKGYKNKALELFEKAITLSRHMKYKYNYGVALFTSGKIEEAKKIFELLLIDHSDEKKILYAYGVCCFYTEDKEKAMEIADAIQLEKDDDDIPMCGLADLYFMCEEYKNHNKIYEEEDYSADVSWLAPYFYALKAMGDFTNLEKKFTEIIAEKNHQIAKAQLEEIDETYTETDKIEYIQRIQKEKEEIINAYYNIKDNGHKPKLEMKLYFIDGCYLIDCPRHQEISENSTLDGEEFSCPK